VINLFIEDARNFVLATPHRYDLILSDSIHPTYAGNGTLYSQDYFKLCEKKLNEGGYVSFWMPMYLLSDRDFKTIIRTFQSVFPNVTIWYVNNAIDAYTIVIGRKEPFELDMELLRAKLGNPEIAKDLAMIDVVDEQDILSYFMMSPQAVKNFCRDGDINSDNHPVIEFRAPKSMTRRRTWYINLSNLLEMRESPEHLIRNAAGTKEQQDGFFSLMARKHRAVEYLIRGQLVNIISFDFAREHRYYMEAAKIDPESRAIKRMSALATSRVMNQKGEEALGRNNYRQALDYFGRSISVNPDPYDNTVGNSRFRTGYIYWKMGENEKAAEEMDLCLSVFPTHKRALIIGTVADYNSSKRTEARDKLDRLLRLYPDDGEVKNLNKRLSGLI
jgi:tetratricopeptide (TPR) repeat protein